MLFSPVFVASDPRPLFSAKPLRSRPLRVRSSLNPLECAVLDKHLVLPRFSRNRAPTSTLECALPRALIHKSFRMRSSEKSGGMGYSRRSLSPKSFPCHTSENSPVSPIIATLPKTGVSNPCVCHTSETPRGIVQPPQNSQPYPLFSSAGACEPAGSVSLPTLPFSTFNCRLSTSSVPSFSGPPHLLFWKPNNDRQLAAAATERHTRGTPRRDSRNCQRSRHQARPQFQRRSGGASSSGSRAHPRGTPRLARQWHARHGDEPPVTRICDH